MEKSLDGVLGIQTHGRRMVGADETTKLWRLSSNLIFLRSQKKIFLPLPIFT